MTDVIVFTVPGQPKAWARAGSNTGQRFTRRTQDAFSGLLKMVASEAMGDRPPLLRTCEVRVTIRKPLPANPSRPKRAAMLEGRLRPGMRPDADNYAKLVGDALNLICWHDDSLIVDLHIHKIYAEIPGVEVAFWPVGDV